jgi:hypothetical protein
LAHRDNSLRCGIWSPSGNSGLWPVERPEDLWVHGLSLPLPQSDEATTELCERFSRAVAPFQPPDGKMLSRNLLKVINERIVHRRTAKRANNWHGLRRKLLGDNDAETGCDLRDYPHQHWAAFGQNAAINDEARRLSNRIISLIFASGVPFRDAYLRQQFFRFGEGI